MRASSIRPRYSPYAGLIKSMNSYNIIIIFPHCADIILTYFTVLSFVPRVTVTLVLIFTVIWNTLAIVFTRKPGAGCLNKNRVLWYLTLIFCRILKKSLGG